MRKRSRSRRSRKYSRSYKSTPLVKKNRLFAHKCTEVVEVIVGNETPGFQRNYTFARFDYAALTPGVLGVNSTNRFNQVKKNYEEYKTTGFQLKFYPTNITGQVSPDDNLRVGGCIQTIFAFDDVDTYDTSGYNTNQITALETFKMYDTKKPVVIYRNNRPLAAAKNYKWRDTNESTTLPNDLPKSSLNLRI